MGASQRATCGKTWNKLGNEMNNTVLDYNCLQWLIFSHYYYPKHFIPDVLNRPFVPWMYRWKDDPKWTTYETLATVIEPVPASSWVIQRMWLHSSLWPHSLPHRHWCGEQEARWVSISSPWVALHFTDLPLTWITSWTLHSNALFAWKELKVSDCLFNWNHPDK